MVTLFIVIVGLGILDAVGFVYTIWGRHDFLTAPWRHLPFAWLYFLMKNKE